MKKITLLLALCQMASASNFGVKLTVSAGGQIASIKDKTKASSLTVFQAYDINRVKSREETSDADNPANHPLIKDEHQREDEESLDCEGKGAFGGLAQIQAFDLESFSCGMLGGIGIANFKGSQETTHANIAFERTGADVVVGAYVGYAVAKDLNIGLGFGGSMINGEYKIEMKGIEDLIKNQKNTTPRTSGILSGLKTKKITAKSKNNVALNIMLFGEYAITERFSVTAMVRLISGTATLSTDDVDCVHPNVVFKDGDKTLNLFLTQFTIGATVKLL